MKIVAPETLRDRDYKLVMANGCWDLLHVGHLRTLAYAKTKGDRLLAAVNTDESVTNLKGPTRPVIPLVDRMEMLAALQVVDYVVSFDDLIELIKIVQPDVIVKGEDVLRAVGAELVTEVYYAPFVTGKSTSMLIDRIRETL